MTQFFKHIFGTVQEMSGITCNTCILLYIYRMGGGRDTGFYRMVRLKKGGSGAGPKKWQEAPALQHFFFKILIYLYGYYTIQ